MIFMITAVLPILTPNSILANRIEPERTNRILNYFRIHRIKRILIEFTELREILPNFNRNKRN